MQEHLWLLFRNVLTIALFPGTVTLVIPYWLLFPVAIPGLSAWTPLQAFAALCVATGLVLLLKSVWSFARIGKGTLAPFDETDRLIVVGLYRYVRNPMYIGVMMILLGESLFFTSWRLLLYALAMFTAFNAFIIGYEERRLSHKYGDEYREYCRRVGGWLPKPGP